MREASISRRQLALALVVVGVVLATVGLFAPWYRLYTTFGDTPGEQLVGPWTALHGSVVAPVSVALECFLPVAVLVASSVTSVFIRAPQWRAILSRLALLLASGCLAVALLVLWVAPQSLPLGWPYYTTPSAVSNTEQGQPSRALPASHSVSWAWVCLCY